MANLPSTFTYVNDVEVAQDAPVTESLFVKLGSNDNYLRDAVDTINGAGPLQSLTTLTSRVNNAKNAEVIGGGQSFLGRLVEFTISQATGTQRWHGITNDGSTWAVEEFEATTPMGTITRTLKTDTGFTITVSGEIRFITHGNNATSSNMTIWYSAIRIFAV